MQALARLEVLHEALLLAKEGLQPEEAYFGVEKVQELPQPLAREGRLMEQPLSPRVWIVATGEYEVRPHPLRCLVNPPERSWSSHLLHFPQYTTSLPSGSDR